MLGALGYAASMLAFAIADSFVVLLVAGFMVGVASTAMVDVSEVALADVAGSRLRRCSPVGTCSRTSATCSAR